MSGNITVRIGNLKSPAGWADHGSIVDGAWFSRPEQLEEQVSLEASSSSARTERFGIAFITRNHTPPIGCSYCMAHASCGLPRCTIIINFAPNKRTECLRVSESLTAPACPMGAWDSSPAERLSPGPVDGMMEQ
ncbi:uncharacterized protein LOC118502497 [Anopheles stephensi]|uniref:uncharacterized protein LOC118502497 n=1 Tax=Anopheles stephensi TaxID=30069 RepID=UPI001658B323|nr:uncharacterized protein LOC118502497 [Anopheles stephensi]